MLLHTKLYGSQMRRAAIFVLYIVAALCLLGLSAIGWAMQKFYRGHPVKEEDEGNCWSYAVPRWLADPRGTYLLMRLSLGNNMPHVFFVKNITGLEVQEYHPVHRIHGWRAWFASIWYKGRERKGSGEEFPGRE